DSAMRYAQEADYGEWAHRLEIFGLDLRHTPSVEAFCHHLLTTHDRLDYIVNNACQTVRRPPGFYEHMVEAEQASLATLPAEAQRLLGAYEGLRAYNLLGAGDAPGDAPVPVPVPAPGIAHAAALSQAELLPGDDDR